MEKQQVKVRGFMGLDQESCALLIGDNGRIFRTSPAQKYMSHGGTIYVETENHIYTSNPIQIQYSESDTAPAESEDEPEEIVDYVPRM